MEMLLKKEMGTAKVILGVISFVTYSLASGPEGVTLEGRKMAMAGTRGVVKKRLDANTFERYQSLNPNQRIPGDYSFSEIPSNLDLADSSSSQIVL